MITECLVTPFYNASKVFIIDDGDLLTPEAQNAFLKVIEEPPEYAVFIIVCRIVFINIRQLLYIPVKHTYHHALHRE